jgi:cysteinyl-tRNA synthetase
MDLVVPDTLSGHRRTVRPRPGRPVALYVCGPTVYDRAHVGHARTYLWFDVARRFLESEGHRVRHVLNITDFEDKIDARAAELGLGWRALARREERAFFADMARLGLRLPEIRPRASAFVPRMIEIARKLERTGRVERAGDEWIYTPPRRRSGENFPTDRQLAMHAVHEPGHPFPTRGDRAGAFMIWRRQDPPKASWPGPWGRGLPGWHLECYAMAERYLGLPVDLHGGGPDLIFPHHYAENEIGLALRGTRFSRTYLHPAFVLLEGDKMSKSKGNLVPLARVLDRVDPGALRWYLLSQPLTRRLEWDEEALARAGEEYTSVRAAARAAVRGPLPTPAVRAVRALSAAVRRDLAHGLAGERALSRLSAWSSGVASPVRPTPGRRAEVRQAIRDIEARTGLALL